MAINFMAGAMEALAPAGNVLAHYAGGGFLGAAAGGAANLAFGEPEDFLGSTMRGAAIGVVGGAAVRSLTTRGGHLNSLGEAIGMSLDDAATAGRTTKLEKLNTKLAAETDADKKAKITEQIAKLNEAQEEGGGITRFFRGISETAKEREERVTREYTKLAGVKDPTEAQVEKMAKLERDYGVSKTAKTKNEMRIGIGDGSDENPVRYLNEDEFVNLDRSEHNAGGFIDPFNEVQSRSHFNRYANSMEVETGEYAYSMQQSSARRSVSSRNSNMMMAGAGLTGAMVGLSHSSGRKNKRRGFNQSRGSRF
jgi:hypothetical protein